MNTPPRGAFGTGRRFGQSGGFISLYGDGQLLIQSNATTEARVLKILEIHEIYMVANSLQKL